ncbi:MAG: hypothetical protein ABMA26_04355, partial [Limisphaerales bacterium]
MSGSKPTSILVPLRSDASSNLTPGIPLIPGGAGVRASFGEDSGEFASRSPSSQVKILIAASGYDDNNEAHEQLRDNALLMLNEGGRFEEWMRGVERAIEHTRPIWESAQASLCEILPMIARHRGVNLNLTFGIYQGTFEPSFCYERDVERSALPSIVRALAEFGSRYQQREVYLLEYLPRPLPANIMATIPRSASLEKAYLTGFTELIRPSDVVAAAQRLRVPGLTMLKYGNQFLFHTVGSKRGQMPLFPEYLKALCDDFSLERCPGRDGNEGEIGGVVVGLTNEWHVLLHRIGLTSAGALIS